MYVKIQVVTIKYNFYDRKLESVIIVWRFWNYQTEINVSVCIDKIWLSSHGESRHKCVFLLSIVLQNSFRYFARTNGVKNVIAVVDQCSMNAVRV